MKIPGSTRNLETEETVRYSDTDRPKGRKPLRETELLAGRLQFVVIGKPLRTWATLGGLVRRPSNSTVLDYHPSGQWGSQSVEDTLTQGIPLPYLDKAKVISVRIQREGWGAGSSAELNHPARRRSRTRRGLSAERGGSQIQLLAHRATGTGEISFVLKSITSPIEIYSPHFSFPASPHRCT